MKLAVGAAKAAIGPAETAMQLFTEMGDTDEQETTLRIINQAHCEKGQPDKAPGRADALRALEDLQEAAALKDRQAWKQATEKLNKSNAFTQKDFEDALQKCLVGAD